MHAIISNEDVPTIGIHSLKLNLEKYNIYVWLNWLADSDLEHWSSMMQHFWRQLERCKALMDKNLSWLIRNFTKHLIISSIAKR